MAIQEGPDTMKQKAVKTRWPVEEGLTAGTTKQVNSPKLEIERESRILKKPRAYS